MLLNADRSNLFQNLETSGVPSGALDRLAAIGITTLAELRDHWEYGNRQLIVEYLGESPMRLVSAAPEAIPSATVRRAAADSTKTLSLIAKCPPIRNQHDRGTCVAFATVGFLEFHLNNVAKPAKRFSEQFVYWGCKNDDGMRNTEGTFVSTARRVLKERGSCLGKTWKYNPLPIPHKESQGPPPDGAEDEAKQFVFSAKAVAAKNPDRIREQLDAGKPVVLSVKTFPSWDYPTTNDTGEITMPIPGEKSDGGHAICVVGYELNSRFPGGGAFIIRNSWGTTWAKPNSRFQPGYGTLFFEYIKKYGLEAYA